MGDFFPYGDRETLVFSSDGGLKQAAESVQIETGDALKTLARLKLDEGGIIWLGGGSHLAGNCFAAGLIDELRIFIQPIILGGGLPFFTAEAPMPHKLLVWTYSHSWPGGILETRYQVPKVWRSDI
jgi:dihydrofolate reductase